MVLKLYNLPRIAWNNHGMFLKYQAYGWKQVCPECLIYENNRSFTSQRALLPCLGVTFWMSYLFLIYLFLWMVLSNASEIKMDYVLCTYRRSLRSMLRKQRPCPSRPPTRTNLSSTGCSNKLPLDQWTPVSTCLSVMLICFCFTVLMLFWLLISQFFFLK